MDLEEMFENPMTYLLGGGGAIAVIVGYVIGGSMGLPPMPIWQVIAMVLVCFIAGAFFANQD